VRGAAASSASRPRAKEQHRLSERHCSERAAGGGQWQRSSRSCACGATQSKQCTVAEGRRAADAARDAAVLGGGKWCAPASPPEGPRASSAGHVRSGSLRASRTHAERPRLDAPRRNEQAVLVSFDEEELVRGVPKSDAPRRQHAPESARGRAGGQHGARRLTKPPGRLGAARWAWEARRARTSELAVRAAQSLCGPVAARGQGPRRRPRARRFGEHGHGATAHRSRSGGASTGGL
jgi:hypothetical protein